MDLSIESTKLFKAANNSETQKQALSEKFGEVKVNVVYD